MKTQTKVLILAAIAALAFLGAWLIPEPTLRPLDLASVRGGDPPLSTCNSRYTWFNCIDFANFCTVRTESTCHDSPRLCAGCSTNDSVWRASFTGTYDYLWTYNYEVDCGHPWILAMCTWHPDFKECYCFSLEQEYGMGCQVVANGGTINCDPPQ
jgi:hypothetical protein